MMRRGDEDYDAEKARFKESRRFCKAVAEKLGGEPDIVFEHVGRATFPTSVLVVKPFGTVVICGATSGHTLDFDVRYLWMRQKRIIGSHFANAWECHRANELIEAGKVRPVLWRTLGFEQVAEAHQLMYENKHLGKIAILVGAESEGLGQDSGRPGRDPGGGGGLDGSRSSADPVVRDPVPGRPVRRGAGARSPRSPCATAPRTTSSIATATTCTSSLRWPRSSQDGLRGLLVRRRSSTQWRTIYSGWYQVPILYTWADVIVAGGRNGRRGNGDAY